MERVRVTKALVVIGLLSVMLISFIIGAFLSFKSADKEFQNATVNVDEVQKIIYIEKSEN